MENWSLSNFPRFFLGKHFIHLPFVADNKAGITRVCDIRVKPNLTEKFSKQRTTEPKLAMRL